ncbi:hypothetical protein PCE1_000122 [Barthelona sp. PCE]
MREIVVSISDDNVVSLKKRSNIILQHNCDFDVLDYDFFYSKHYSDTFLVIVGSGVIEFVGLESSNVLSVQLQKYGEVSAVHVCDPQGNQQIVMIQVNEQVLIIEDLHTEPFYSFPSAQYRMVYACDNIVLYQSGHSLTIGIVEYIDETSKYTCRTTFSFQVPETLDTFAFPDGFVLFKSPRHAEECDSAVIVEELSLVIASSWCSTDYTVFLHLSDGADESAQLLIDGKNNFIQTDGVVWPLSNGVKIFTEKVQIISFFEQSSLEVLLMCSKDEHDAFRRGQALNTYDVSSITEYISCEISFEECIRKFCTANSRFIYPLLLQTLLFFSDRYEWMVSVLGVCLPVVELFDAPTLFTISPTCPLLPTCPLAILLMLAHGAYGFEEKVSVSGLEPPGFFDRKTAHRILSNVSPAPSPSPNPRMWLKTPDGMSPMLRTPIPTPILAQGLGISGTPMSTTLLEEHPYMQLQASGSMSCVSMIKVESLNYLLAQVAPCFRRHLRRFIEGFIDRINYQAGGSVLRLIPEKRMSLPLVASVVGDDPLGLSPELFGVERVSFNDPLVKRLLDVYGLFQLSKRIIVYVDDLNVSDIVAESLGVFDTESVCRAYSGIALTYMFAFSKTATSVDTISVPDIVFDGALYQRNDKSGNNLRINMADDGKDDYATSSQSFKNISKILASMVGTASLNSAQSKLTRSWLIANIRAPELFFTAPEPYDDYTRAGLWLGLGLGKHLNAFTAKEAGHLIRGMEDPFEIGCAIFGLALSGGFTFEVLLDKELRSRSLELNNASIHVDYAKGFALVMSIISCALVHRELGSYMLAERLISMQSLSQNNNMVNITQYSAAIGISAACVASPQYSTRKQREHIAFDRVSSTFIDNLMHPTHSTGIMSLSGMIVFALHNVPICSLSHLVNPRQNNYMMKLYGVYEGLWFMRNIRTWKPVSVLFSEYCELMRIELDGSSEKSFKVGFLLAFALLNIGVLSNVNGEARFSENKRSLITKDVFSIYSELGGGTKVDDVQQALSLTALSIMFIGDVSSRVVSMALAADTSKKPLNRVLLLNSLTLSFCCYRASYTRMVVPKNTLQNALNIFLSCLPAIVPFGTGAADGTSVFPVLFPLCTLSLTCDCIDYSRPTDESVRSGLFKPDVAPFFVPFLNEMEGEEKARNSLFV